MNISHRQAQLYLELQADDGLNPAQHALLETHLRACRSCRAYAAELNQFQHRLRTVLQAQIPARRFQHAELDRRLQRVRPHLRLPGARRWLPRLEFLAWTAGLVALTLVLVWSIRSLLPSTTAPQLPSGALGRRSPAPSPPSSQAPLPSTPAPALPSSQAPEQRSPLPLAWTYDFTETVLGLAALPEQDLVSIYTDAGRFALLDQDGSPRLSLTLPRPVYTFEIASLDRSISHSLPAVLTDGTILVVSADRHIYATDRSGQVRWEAPLESGPVGPPLQVGDRLYLLDEQARLYAFGSEGLLWSYQPLQGRRPASQLVRGPDGSLYYVATTYSQTFLQAVSAAGQQLWAAEVKTDFPYAGLQISPDGRLLALRDDLFEASGGARLAFQSEVRVHEYLLGRDGQLYLRSGHTVMLVRPSGERLEILSRADWDYEEAGIGNVTHPTQATEDANGVIWLEYRGQDEEQLVWLDGSGKVLGRFLAPRLQAYWSQIDVAGSRVLACRTAEDFYTSECAVYTARRVAPVWEATLEGTGGLIRSAWQRDRVYFLMWSGALHRLDLPPAP